MLFLLAEFTTMAGRRLRDAVKAVLTSAVSKEFNSNVRIVISGLTNTYSQYVTTFEEYEVQRYEVCDRVTHSSLFHFLFTNFFSLCLQYFQAHISPRYSFIQ